MFKLMWVPKKYKGFSIKEIYEDANRILRECEIQQQKGYEIYANMLVLQNRVANLTEEEARHNLSVIVPYMESLMANKEEE